MSDVQTAGAALGVPPELVQRSAAARAAVDGTSIDDILAAWAGDAPPPAPPEPTETPDDEVVDDTSPAPEAEAEPAAAAVAVIEQPEVVAPQPRVLVAEPAVELEPVALSTRVKTAVRIGAWTGAALGVVGFLVATVFWAPNTTVDGSSAPIVQVSPTSIIAGMALVSVVFGAIVAGISRAATGWANPAMQLSGSKATTVWLGAAAGLVLGVAAGATLNGFGTPVEGSDPAMVALPVLATLLVMILGGAMLGALTALIPQLIGVPVAVAESDAEEVETLKKRLGNAMSIPVAGVVLLVVLVLPFAYALIQSNHLAPGIGGAVVAIIAAGGILGFSALAGSKPEMRISMGDVVWALVGIGAILVIVISVLLYTGDGAHEEEPGAEEAAVAFVL